MFPPADFNISPEKISAAGATGIGHQQLPYGFSEHLARLVAKHSNGARIPEGNLSVFVGANQPVTDRHCDALKTLLGNSTQQATQVDFTQCTRN